ncbi:adhesin biosynthesis transcription regulatory family protein [Escherichia coli]|mgnify:FL=1|uniref:adhesin biosynthesis transcription regulatory family protein n=1 Tax=Escherichia coli TaxID=562 RepID=UPI0004866C05|nr:adhesin biosynthesis transcription regulatory family protein [Escherichia coli]EFA3982872.1 transcriptional regulator [Escherichia coli]EFC8797976.1 transcriptional regulator [Escherichia coli]EFF9449204.1 transcriptional regulator [Escherichia coli]EFH2975977.1 transcriptional regulator [Escherichia coli]EFH5757191.1 transcriptional regulator [Escherichia coli]
MNSSDLYLSKKHGCTLSPGKMSERQFWLLAEISPVHSEKVLNALRDFLVLGYTRREACERHEVSQGYFSGALRRFQMINQAVIKLIPFYIQKELHSKTVVQ